MQKCSNELKGELMDHYGVHFVFRQMLERSFHSNTSRNKFSPRWYSIACKFTP